MAHQLLIAGLAAGGLFLYSKQQANARTAALIKNGTRTGVTYTTPTGVAQELTRGVIGILRGVLPAAPAGIFADGPQPPSSPGGSAAQGTLGWNLYDSIGAGTTSSGSGDPYNPDPQGWSLPSASKAVDASVARFGQSIDQIAAAPVYDPSTDFITNPFGGWQLGAQL